MVYSHSSHLRLFLVLNPEIVNSTVDDAVLEDVFFSLEKEQTMQTSMEEHHLFLKFSRIKIYVSLLFYRPLWLKIIFITSFHLVLNYDITVYDDEPFQPDDVTTLFLVYDVHLPPLQ